MSCISDPSPWKTDYFVPVCCFIVYNFFDLAGKEIATRLQWPGMSSNGQWTLLAASILRIGMIPLFMYSNVAPNNRSIQVIDCTHPVMAEKKFLKPTEQGHQV